MQERAEPGTIEPTYDINAGLRGRLSGRALQDRQIAAELRELMTERHERASERRRLPSRRS